MQGAVFMPQNPQQGFPPPTSTIVTEMAASSSPNHITKEILANRSDSGIYTTTTNTTTEQSDLSKNSEITDIDNRSDCSSPERKYFCPICNEMLNYQHEFTLHIRSHNNENEIQDNEKRYVCRICSKVLSSSSSLDRHVLVHSGERPFNCKYCGDTFTTNGNMHRHMRTHSNKSENSYESDGSSDTASSKSTEFNNNKIERPNKRKLENVDVNCSKKAKEDYEESRPFTCPVCERDDFNTLFVLQTHLEDNHPDYPAKCSQCKQVFLNNKMLSIHKTTVHENKLSKQPVVGFKDLTFVDFSSEKFPHIARRECEINLHKSAGNSDLNFLCKNCNRAFPCSSSLEIHEKNCVVSDNLKATDLTTISQGDIRRMDFFSRLNLINNSPEKQSILSSPKNLREHFAKVMDSSKDLADIQSILSNINLQQLQNKQNSDLRLPLPKQSDQISESQKTEEEESQDMFAIEFRKMKLRGEFPCRLCTAVFPNLRALKGHNRAHLNGSSNGTYYCNMCPHSSIDKAALIRHMRTHNGDRPYECSLCNYAFTTKANCERHLRNRHAKTTREDVKKSIIYHPSEDPTNDDINKLTTKEESKKSCIASPCLLTDMISSENIHNSTPKLPDLIRTSVPEIKPDINMKRQHIPTTLQDLPPLHSSRIFPSLNDTIQEEGVRNIQKGPFLSTRISSFVPSPDFIAAENLSNKIQVKNIEALKEPNIFYENESEDEYLDEEEDREQPLDLVLDLSKKKDNAEAKNTSEDEEPQDLTKKKSESSSPPFPHNMNHIFTHNLLKTQANIDPAVLYATQLALYRGSFPALPNWSGFPINPLFFSTMNSNLSQNAQEIKERMQRFQLCGGTMISEELKNIHNIQQLPPQEVPLAFNSFNVEPNSEVKLENNFSTPKKNKDMKPLSLNIESNFVDNFSKLQSPIPQSKPDLLQSPNSVKMVIKNGVLMPKQKQRRYRTERPFTCEHCSARFTLRSNMERHIKQQHPQYWSQRQRGTVGTPGRKPQILQMKSNYCDLNIPNYETPKVSSYEESKEYLNEKLKLALITQQLKTNHIQTTKEEETEEDCELVIDENDERIDTKTDESQNSTTENQENRISKSDENQDLVPVSRLLDNASQQQFKEFFKREGEEHEIGVVSEEDEEGLVASSSTSEENISGAEENKPESDVVQPVKKKSAYSLAPNRVSCPYCSRKFPWTSSLRRHILTHTGQKPFKCSHCPLLFTTKSNCDRHLLRKHGNAATTITNDSTNPNYLMRNVPERPFKCSNCPSSTFSTYSNLKKHISCKHATNAQGDDIKAQGYEAGSSEDEKNPNSELKSVWENQVAYNKAPIEPVLPNSDLPFKCHLCEGSFSDRQDALNHIKDKHSSEYELLLSKNALDLNATTPDEAPHQEEEDVEIRGKFPDYSNRKVICAFCMRRFWSAEDLRRHMRTHTGERPFSCDICRRRFTLKHSMLRHRKKHNVNFEHDTVNSDEDGNNVPPFSVVKKSPVDPNAFHKTDESDGGNESGDLISNLLGLRDRSIIDKVLTASADDAAKLLGVRNGAK